MNSFSQMLYTLNHEAADGCDGCFSLGWATNFVVALDDPSTIILVIILSVIILYLLMGILSVFIRESMLDFVTETAYLEYWSNRLAYMHEIRSLENFLCCFCPSGKGFLKYLTKSWKFLVDSLKNARHRQYYDDHLFRTRSLSMFLTRIFALFALPAFVIGGVLTAGVLWPPQIRRYILGSLDWYNQHDQTSSMSLDKEASKLRIDLNRLETSSAEQKSILKNELLVMKDMLIQMNRQLNEKAIIDSRR